MCSMDLVDLGGRSTFFGRSGVCGARAFDWENWEQSCVELCQTPP